MYPICIRGCCRHGLNVEVIIEMRSWIGHFTVVGFKRFRVLAMVLLFGLLMIWVFLHFVFFNPQKACSSSNLSSVSSVDKQWEARVDQIVCDSGPLSSGVFASVSLISSDDDNQRVIILGVDTAGKSEDVPKLLWMSPRRLKVKIPNSQFVKTSTTKFKDVNIDIETPR